MTMKSIKIGNLMCDCFQADATDICYILSPIRLAPERLEEWSGKYHTHIVGIHGMDWDNDLPPWTAPGVEPGDAAFKGNAVAFLSFLRTEVMPEVESLFPSKERTLMGISLSGMFTVWTWMNGNDFTHIASISGSFWYDHFTDWMLRTGIGHKTGVAYFSLGDKEGIKGNPRFSTVAVETAKVVQFIKDNGIPVLFEATAGTHFAPIYPRMEKAFVGLEQLKRKE